VAEEIVFRGALQPRFGLIATAFLFAAVHTQYGITFASLEVFVLGLGLGWLRAASKSTLPGIVTHAGYDLIVGLIGLVH
jgi:membrane protease YdiL (CAAX protease family)